MAAFGNLSVVADGGYVGVFGTRNGHLFELYSDDSGNQFQWRDPVKTAAWGPLSPGVCAVCAPNGDICVFGFLNGVLVENTIDRTSGTWAWRSHPLEFGGVSLTFQTGFGQVIQQGHGSPFPIPEGIIYSAPSAVTLPARMVGGILYPGYVSVFASAKNAVGAMQNVFEFKRSYVDGKEDSWEWSSLNAFGVVEPVTALSTGSTICVYLLYFTTGSGNAWMDQARWEGPNNGWVGSNTGGVVMSNSSPLLQAVCCPPAIISGPEALEDHRIFVSVSQGMCVGKPVPGPGPCTHLFQLNENSEFDSTAFGPPSTIADSFANTDVIRSFVIHAVNGKKTLWELVLSSSNEVGVWRAHVDGAPDFDTLQVAASRNLESVFVIAGNGHVCRCFSPAALEAPWSTDLWFDYGAPKTSVRKLPGRRKGSQALC